MAFFMLINASAVLVLAERKVMGFMQQRYGPYLVGPHGMLQPFADILKLLMKEELRPKGADKWLFTLAPVLAVTTAFAAFATVPFGGETTLLRPARRADQAGRRRRQRRRARDLRRHLDGRLRHRARGLVVEQQVRALRRAARLGADDQLRAVVRDGAGGGDPAGRFDVGARGRGRADRLLVRRSAPKWYIFLQPVGFIIYFIAGVAETNRAPFDFPEAEQELVAGFNTEYSSVRFALFPQAEYINMVTDAAVATDLYLGGWHGLLPFYTPLDSLIEQWNIGWLVFLAKIGGILFFYIWMRWTVPRYRYDQLMKFGWKYLFPASVINLLVTAAVVLYFNA